VTDAGERAARDRTEKLLGTYSAPVLAASVSQIIPDLRSRSNSCAGSHMRPFPLC